MLKLQKTKKELGEAHKFQAVVSFRFSAEHELKKIRS